MARRLRCFAVCPPGLETVLATEIGRGQPGRGGVAFAATTRELYAANLGLRTATRVLLRVASFRARSFDELESALAGVEWDRWLRPGDAPAVRVTARSSRLYHTGAVADRVHRAMGRVPGDGPLVIVRISHDTATVSVDSSGDPLHRRGWRLATAKAPMRPTLAAAVLLAVGWDGTDDLLDPLCGSGTIPIEAAALALGLAPGSGRRFAFERWPSFEPGTWASVVETARGRQLTAGPAIVGSDRDAGAIEAAAANAERAGLGGAVDLSVRPLSDAHPTGWLVTNPPYGRRVGGGDLRDLYARLGQVATGHPIALLVADRRLAAHTGLRLRERFRTTSGGLRVQCLSGRGDSRRQPR